MGNKKGRIIRRDIQIISLVKRFLKYRTIPGTPGVRIVGDDGGVVARGAGELAAVPGLLLQVADNRSLGHVANGHHVTNRQMGLESATVTERKLISIRPTK